MVRLILAVVIVIASSCVGWSLSARLTKRYTTLQDYELTLERALTRLNCTADRLCVVFSDNPMGYCFVGSRGFDEQWKELASRYQSILTAEDMTMLCAFAGVLGEGDIEAQLSAVRMYLSLIQDHKKQAQAELEQKSKLYRTLAFSAGMTVALFLI